VKVEHASRELANLLILSLVGSQMAELDLREIHVHRVQQEGPVLGVQSRRTGF
jgi:hypothetical protein